VPAVASERTPAVDLTKPVPSAVVMVPVLPIEKSVEVAVPAVVEAMVNKVVGAPSPFVEVATIESCAYGVVVPRPMRSATNVPA